MKTLTFGALALAVGSAAFAIHGTSIAKAANHSATGHFAAQQGPGGGYGPDGQGRPDGPPPGERRHGGPGGPGGHRGPGGRMFERLNLTDDQKTQIKALHEKAMTDSKPYFDQLHSIHQQIHQLVEGGQFNEDAIRALAARQAAAETELTVIRIRTEMAVSNVLTPEQKAKMGEMHKRRMGPPPPPQGDQK